MEITKKVILAKREETPVEWEKHKEINHKISEDFKKSLDNFDEKLYGNIEPITISKFLTT